MEKEFIKKGKWGTCLWGIDETGMLYISEGTAEDISRTGMPWKDSRTIITGATVLGKVNFLRGASLAELFKGCIYMEKADLSGFDTKNVIDMHSMFEGCTVLKELDLSSFDTRNCHNLDKMFFKCARLTDIILGENFDLEGNGTTSIDGKLAIKNGGKYRHAKVIMAQEPIVRYYENAGRDVYTEKKTVHGIKYMIDNLMYSAPYSKSTQAAYKFMGWNTAADGSGVTLLPGDELKTVDEDINFYAMWASTPTFGELKPIAEFSFGETIPLASTEIRSANDPITRGYIEISPTGEPDSWREIDRKTILPATCNGWLLRLCAENSVGKAASNPVTLRIRKAHINMSSVRWVGEQNVVYDGMPKRVCVEGVPDGITPRYKDNEATDVGVFTATCELEYDADNYEKPLPLAPYVWEIRKAIIDPAELRWSAYDNFVYDGNPHSVRITNLPDTATVIYEGTEETPAGKYLATARIGGNYRAGGPVKYEWEIKKASYDLSGIVWDYKGPFTYNKSMHEIKLSGYPESLGVTYKGNFGKTAGDYVAVASFINPDTHNWFTPEDITQKWSISKRIADMSDVRWTYDEPFIYDGTSKKVELAGLPEGVYAEYDNASASNAGVYIAHANLKFDSDNITAEQPADCQWKINKDRIDVSEVYWDYVEPFTYSGHEHTVELKNVPETLIVEYKDNVKVETGKYAASATLTPIDPMNYERPNVNACTWSINKAPINLGHLEWTDVSEFVYDGGEKTVEIISDLGDNVSVEYIYNKGKNAGRYFTKAVFSAVDDKNFKAPESVGFSWSIAKSDYDMGSVTWDYVHPFTYDGQENAVALINVPDGVSVSYSNARGINAGDYTAVAKFGVADTHNYNANIPDRTLTWKIRKAEYDLSNVRWQDEREFTYDAEPKEIKLLGLPSGLVPIYAGNDATDAGEYIATAEFEYDARNYEKPEAPTCRWKINKTVVDVSAVSWNYEEPFVYDGEEKTVEIIGVPEGAYVEYSNSIAIQADTYVASANVIPTDSSNYYSSRIENLTWRIMKGDYDMSAAHWNYEKPFIYDGNEKGISIEGLPEGVTPTYRSNVGTNAGGYRASVSFKIADENNFKAPDFPDCEWAIDKADYDMSVVQWDYNGEFKYNGRMHEVSLRGLPEGVRAVYTDNAGVETGSYVASADLIPYDKDNYNKPKVHNCVWQIERADHEMGGVKWDYQGSKTYNGRTQSVMLEQLPNGVIASYTDNEATEVGSYTAKAVLTVSDPKNYNTPMIRDCDWEILPADYDMLPAKWNLAPEGFTYDGNRKTIELEGLPSNVTATYEGNSGIQAGEYLAVATFATSDPNFKSPESQTFRWNIDQADADMSKVKWDYNREFTYDGTPKKVEIIGLPDGVGVEYSGNVATDAGEYIATATFSIDAVNYRTPEPMKLHWVVNRANADIKRARWDYAQAFVYDGEPKKVVIAGLPDYMEATYSYNEATEVGTYVAHADLRLKGTNNYNIPTESECEWKIIKGNYDMSDVRWEGDLEYIYDGKEKGIRLVGLPEGVEPVYTDSKAINAGKYIAKADFVFDQKNFNKPSFPAQAWRIHKTSYDMTGVKWDYDKEFIYDGYEKKVSLTGLPQGVSAVYNGDSGVTAGRYEAKPTFIYDEINYEKPKFNACRWTIGMAEAPIDIEQIHWNYEKPFVYDGTIKGVALSEKELQPTFAERLRGKKPRIFLEGIPEGFEVVYENNEAIDAGVYYANARLVSTIDTNYRDFIVPECRWEILKAEIDTSSVVWDYTNAYVYDGVIKSVKLKGLPETLRATYTNNAAINAGDYEALATLEVLDPANYETPTPVKGCWWTIKKATYDMSSVSWTFDEDFTYTGLEHTVTVTGLPEGVNAYAYRGNRAVEAGAYTAEVTLDYNNKFNYEAPQVPDLKWRIRKKRIDTSNATWNYDKSTLFVYDGGLKEVKLVGIPEGIEVVYVDNCKVNAGTYVARARLTYDTRNCEAKEIPDLKWTIAKANYDVAAVHWSYEKPFTYDGYEKSIVLCNLPDTIDIRYRDNKATGVGSYTAKAYLSYDSENYNPPELAATIDWEIVK